MECGIALAASGETSHSSLQNASGVQSQGLCGWHRVSLERIGTWGGERREGLFSMTSLRWWRLSGCSCPWMNERMMAMRKLTYYNPWLEWKMAGFGLTKWVRLAKVVGQLVVDLRICCRRERKEARRKNKEVLGEFWCKPSRLQLIGSTNDTGLKPKALYCRDVNTLITTTRKGKHNPSPFVPSNHNRQKEETKDSEKQMRRFANKSFPCRRALPFWCIHHPDNTHQWCHRVCRPLSVPSCNSRKSCLWRRSHWVIELLLNRSFWKGHCLCWLQLCRGSHRTRSKQRFSRFLAAPTGTFLHGPDCAERSLVSCRFYLPTPKFSLLTCLLL